eukprot:TRINITY_DN5715_c0_g1_i4.p2 TRINITY_DN5715_c0_g1~~TRINITY_DN5715_c0_g1_i4.p2  ORF type:complete len:130 (-),score=34.74 TRINITY_DN5715_c0_g1_i4:18-407(-)
MYVDCIFAESVLIDVAVIASFIVEFFFFFLMIRRPPRSTHCISSAASDVYKRQPPRSALNTVPPVSYTHLTLPTICSVQISVVAVSLKKKKKIPQQTRQQQQHRSKQTPQRYNQRTCFNTADEKTKVAI